MSVKKLAQIGMVMTKCYETFVDEKRQLLNHPRMVEYFFNKPTPKSPSDPKGLTKLLSDYDMTTKIVRMQPTDTINIMSHFFVMSELLQRYDHVHKIHQKNNSKIKIDYLPLHSSLSENELMILHILDKYADRYKMGYIYKWNFMVEGEHNNASKIPTVNISEKFVYDFYGCIVHHGQLVQFVVQHNDLPIWAQFALFQMNIHLLVQTKPDKKEIGEFLHQIRNTSQYIIHHPTKKMGDSTKISKWLGKFITEYNYNHIICLRQPQPKDAMYDSDDDEYFAQKTEKDVEIEEDQSECFVITDDIVNKIIQKKEHYHPEKRRDTRADDIMVELVGSKK